MALKNRLLNLDEKQTKKAIKHYGDQKLSKLVRALIEFVNQLEEIKK